MWSRSVQLPIWGWTSAPALESTKYALQSDSNYAWQSLWTLRREFQPGFEIFGDVGPLDRAPGIRDQQLRAGPVAYGKVSLGEALGELKYGIGYLFGLTHATEKGALKWNLEWEKVF